VSASKMRKAYRSSESAFAGAGRGGGGGVEGDEFVKVDASVTVLVSGLDHEG